MTVSRREWISTPAGKAFWTELDVSHKPLDLPYLEAKFQAAVRRMTRTEVEAEIKRLDHNSRNEYGELWWQFLHRADEDEIPL